MSDIAIALPAPGRARLGGPAGLTGRALGVLSDNRLAEMAAEGAGEQAFAAIYARYHQPLYRYALSIVRNSDDAADALQSAMLKAYLALPAKKAEVVLKPWLYRIVHNEAVSVIRRRTRHDELSDVNSPLAPSADESAAERGRLAELVDDLGQLDERQRAALVMRELNGLEFDEIATAFCTSPAAAKQAVYEARVALHERAEGRAMSCEPVRQALSEGDRRRLRGRKLRAHLRACSGCQGFEAAIAQRRGDLAALAPALPAPAAAAIFKAVVGSGGGGAGHGGAGAVVGGAAATGVAAKSLAALLTVTAGAFAVGSTFDAGGPHATAAAAGPPPTRPSGLTRQAPPLTNLYVLAVAGRPALRLHRPADLLAATRPHAPSDGGTPAAKGDVASPGGRAGDGAGANNGAPDAASGPLGLGDAPLTTTGPGGSSTPLPGTPVVVPGVDLPGTPVPSVHTPALPQVPALPVPVAPVVPGSPSAPPVSTPQLPSTGVSTPSLSPPAVPAPGGIRLP